MKNRLSPKINYKSSIKRMQYTPKKHGALNILDFYIHQGHQYEFSKIGHNFYLTSPGGGIPEWNSDHRPKPENIKFVRESAMLNPKHRIDIIMCRSPIHQRRVSRFINAGAIPIAVIQTISPFPVHGKVRHIVWNSYATMKKHHGFYNSKVNHYYIPHGFDPEEFQNLSLDRNNRVLTVANVFKGRAKIMGYPLWRKINNLFGGICDVLGHGNEDLEQGYIGQAVTFNELINIYNRYGIYFNPTADSAMPRSRVEAAMCGSPIVTTVNNGASRYFVHKKNSIATNDIDILKKSISDIIDSKDMRQELGFRAREMALKYFHIKNYIDRWNTVISKL